MIEALLLVVALAMVPVTAITRWRMVREDRRIAQELDNRLGSL